METRINMPVLVLYTCRLMLTCNVHFTLWKHHPCSVWDLLTENNGKGQFPPRLKIKVSLKEQGTERELTRISGFGITYELDLF